MTPKNCPECGTILIREVIQRPRPEDYSGSISFPRILPSNCREGSLDIASISTSYVYKCPNCGYAYFAW